VPQEKAPRQASAAAVGSSAIPPTAVSAPSAEQLPGKSGAWSAPLNEPAQFAQAGAQVNYEITQRAIRGDRKLASAVNSTAREPHSREDVIEECRRGDLRPLWTGRTIYRWLVLQPDRGDEKRELRKALVAAGLLTAAARLDGMICLYWIGDSLGWDEAQRLNIAVIRELRPLFVRDPVSEEYRMRRGLEHDIRRLWRQMVRQNFSAAMVHAEVQKIRPARPKTLKITAAARRFARLIRELKRMPADEEQLRSIVRLCEDRLAAGVPREILPAA